MIRRHARLAPSVLLIAIVCLLPPAAVAQYRPPAPPPVPAPVPEPPPPVDAGQPGTQPLSPQAPQSPSARGTRSGTGWETGVVLDGVWEHNVGFLDPPGPDDIYGSLSANVARWRRSTRSELRIEADGTGYMYQDLRDLNRLDGAASLAATTQLSRRTSGHVSGDFSYGHTDSEELLVTEGLLLPPMRTQTGAANGGLSWRLAERTTLAVDGRWQEIWFDSDLLLETQTLTGMATLARRFGPRDEVSLRATVMRVEDDISTRREPSVTLGYRRNLTRSLTFAIDAGSSRSETVQSTADTPPLAQWYFTGGASLSGRLRRTTLVATYQHGLRPAYGLGVTEMTDLAGLAATIPIGRSLQLIVNGVLARRQDDGVTTSRDADVYAAAAARLARRLRLVAGYRYRARDVPGRSDVILNDRASVSLVWESEAVSDSGTVAR